MRGDSFLTNLTIRTPIETEASLADIYLSSEATYRVLLPGRFVSFSPECFVKLQGDELATHPMKGTIDARIPNAAEKLRAGYKEGCEHHTIVDLMRNDLSRVAEGVHVRRFKYLTELHTSSGPLLQMSSEVVGSVDRSKGLRLGDLILQLLPAGSISGAPKERTVALIQEAESHPRGFYTGVCGYFDGSSLDSAVLIRFVEEDASGAHFYRSGGGITINSVVEDEIPRMPTEDLHSPVADATSPSFIETFMLRGGELIAGEAPSGNACFAPSESRGRIPEVPFYKVSLAPPLGGKSRLTSRDNRSSPPRPTVSRSSTASKGSQPSASSPTASGRYARYVPSPPDGLRVQL